MFGGGGPKVKEIANPGLRVSINHCSSVSANLEVFDVSRKEQVRKIYSFEEVSGGRIILKICLIISPLWGTGTGDVAYNPLRSILGAIPIKGKIAYHLYNISTSKHGDIVKLIRKSKWHAQQSNK